MKRALLLACALALFALPALADWRADIGVDIPLVGGVPATDEIDGVDPDTINIINELTILLPEIMIGYEASVGPVNLGAGGRIFTFLVESVAYPAAFAEVELGPVAVNLNVGGGAFLFFGLWNSLQTGSLFIPDLSAHLKIGPSFRLGLGAAAFMGIPELDASPYLLYLSGKFVVRW